MASTRPSSERKHRAMLDAAAVLFLRDGFAGANMDELAARAGVSKQTVYAHFGSKEALFVAMVSTLTSDAGDAVHTDRPDPASVDELPAFLAQYAERQLMIVLDPRLLQLRRLVIGEVARFPELARTLWERGPNRAIGTLSQRFARLASLGMITVADPDAAATHFNWLIMADPINRAMLLGDAAVPSIEALRPDIDEGVRIFLAAHSAPEPSPRSCRAITQS